MKNLNFTQQYLFKNYSLLKKIIIFAFSLCMLTSCSKMEESYISNEPELLLGVQKNADNTSIEPMKIIGTENTELDNDDTFIGKCIAWFEVDIDQDNIQEIICPRLAIFENDNAYCHSLVIDIFTKDKKWVLRQKFDRGDIFYGMETFFDIVDLNNDNIPELITKLQVGPDCPGCESYRIYSYKMGQFKEALSVFNVSPYVVKSVIENLAAIHEYTISYCKRASNKETRRYWNTFIEDYDFDLWLLDSNNDGKLEILQLIEPLTDDCLTDSQYLLLIMELSQKGSVFTSSFLSVDMQDSFRSADIIGLLKQNNEINLFVNGNYAGTSFAFPILHIFKVNGNNLTKINEFYGFYYHNLSQRFKDLDQDGDIEIIYIDNVIWPSSAPHCDSIPIFGIAEFSKKNGKYLEADEKFQADLRRLNR